ncbi:MAG TPA: hypothetical protein VGA48_01740 [Thermoplasmata archaeon]
MNYTKRVWPGLATFAVLAFIFVVMPGSSLAATTTAGFRVGPNVQVFNNPGVQAEVAIAANPVDDKNLIIGTNDGRLTSTSCSISSTSLCVTNWIGVFTSTDGGKTWLPQLLPGFPGGPTGVLTGFQEGADPIVAFDGRGAAYAGGIFWKGPTFLQSSHGFTLALSRSDDGGLTWNEPSILASGSGLNPFPDHPQMAVDNTGGGQDGNVYVIWHSLVGLASSKDVQVGTSRDRGMTWSTIRVSGPIPSDDFKGLYGDTIVAVGPSGVVYAAWDEPFQGVDGVPREKFWMTVSLDGGGSFQAPWVIEDAIAPIQLPNAPFRASSFPVLAIDTSRGTHSGRLYLTWSDQRSGNADILLKASDDGGKTWSTIRRVNDDSGTSAQFDAWVSVAPNGRVDLSFFDRRDDPNDYLLRRYYAGSTDGGVTFVNVRVSDVPFDPAVLGFVGDYNQIASTLKVAHPAWTDGRNGLPGNGNTDIYTASIFA